MIIPDKTRWTLVEAAALGDVEAREAFVFRYYPVVRAYLVSRWRRSCAADIDDAVQEVFLQCLRPGGGLDRLQRLQRREFRPYLLGIVRNVARMAERDRARKLARQGDDDSPETVDDERPSQIFDAAWARSIIAAALQLMATRCAGSHEAERRMALLRARFQDDLPVRRIADLHQLSPPEVHRAIARGKIEFRAALTDVLCSHRDTPATDREIVELLHLAGR